MIAIIDYGAGNLFSVKNALDFLGVPSVITRKVPALIQADQLILPGVGAFPEAMQKLAESGLIPTIRQQAEKKPLLGICLGMQILFETGYEFQKTLGLGLIPGQVEPLAPAGLKVPHMGWNALQLHRPSPLTQGLSGGDYVYFVHSFAAKTDERYILAHTDYGGPVTALVARGQVYGAQFHPEKSGEIGLALLRNFSTLKGEAPR